MPELRLLSQHGHHDIELSVTIEIPNRSPRRAARLEVAYYRLADGIEPGLTATPQGKHTWETWITMRKHLPGKETLLTPANSRYDVERYVKLRAAAMDLNHRIVRTIPRQAMEDMGEALGIRHNGTLFFETEDVSSVLMDCCLYDWIEDGLNVVQRYALDDPSRPGTDDDYLLDAYLHAEYRILRCGELAPGAGIYATDEISGDRLFVMDIAMSRSAQPRVLWASRLIPLETFWMTGGAGLPIFPEARQRIFRRLEEERLLNNGRLAKSHRMPLVVARECLASGAGQRVRYEQLASQPEPILPRRVLTSPGRNDRCPCGSGRKYKHCCLGRT